MSDLNFDRRTVNTQRLRDRTKQFDSDTRPASEARADGAAPKPGAGAMMPEVAGNSIRNPSMRSSDATDLLSDRNNVFLPGFKVIKCRQL
jgi:hypothetical protein